MRKVWILLGFVSILAAESLRPPVPDAGYAEQKRETLKQCKVPAQVVVLPPMVEPDYRDCANRYYKPEAQQAAYNLSLMMGAEATVDRIEIAPGFLRAYEIDATVNQRSVRLLCDENVNHCYAIGKVYEKPEQKDKK